MGNGAPFSCQTECFPKIGNYNKTIITQNVPLDDFLPKNLITNSYITNNYSLYQIIQNFFLRNLIPIKNCEITVIPKVTDNSKNKNTYIVNELKVKPPILKKEVQFVTHKNDKEKEIDLNYYTSKINSINSNFSIMSNEKEKLRMELKEKKLGIRKLNSLHIKTIKEEDDVHRKISEQKLKRTLLKKDNIKNVNEENEGILRPYIHITSKNIRRRKNSSSSIFSNIENTFITHHPKGYYQYKHLNYRYLGKSDKNNNKMGFGVITYEDKTKVKGYFNNDKLYGYGKFIDLRSIYSGYYVDSIPKGFGIYIQDNVTTVGNDWSKNHLNGVGIQIFGHYIYYQGEFIKSVKEGVGLYHWTDGTICFGEWSDDKMNGYGGIKYSNNNIYIGEFKNNIIDGWGEFLWHDNKYYCGEYKNGLKHGFGIYIIDFKKLNVYIGFWEYGQTCGFGIKINDNNMVVAVWKDGKRLNYLKYWEIKDYLKPNQIKYAKFLHKDIKFYKQFIAKLQEYYELLIEQYKNQNCLGDISLYM